jgi:hypothetical protein
VKLWNSEKVKRDKCEKVKKVRGWKAEKNWETEKLEKLKSEILKKWII